MFVEAVIRGRTFENVFEIPRDAVREEGAVLVIDTDGRMHRRPIQLLYRGDRTVIVEKGLMNGERICLSPISVFIENMQVRTAPSDGAAGNGETDK